jgi:hypothetical protein
MIDLLKKKLKKLGRTFGFEISQSKHGFKIPVDFTQEHIDLIQYVQPYTMTSAERIFALVEATKYVVKSKIAGDIVECGVWKGGSIMAVAKTLVGLRCFEKELYLFDTFEGMTKPSLVDVSRKGEKAAEEFQKRQLSETSSEWCYAGLEEVREAVCDSGYDLAKIHFVKGKVEDTIPEKAPDCISLLRLDTDWYESTKHELIHLFPRLSKGGVIIIDDYGYWLGARKATDEYLNENNVSLLLNRIDASGRIGVKL